MTSGDVLNNFDWSIVKDLPYIERDDVECIMNYITRVLRFLFDDEQLKPVSLCREWFDSFPKDEPGVYVFFEHSSLQKRHIPVYVGETDDIKKRMKHLKDTRHHVIRRNIGLHEFSDDSCFQSASSKSKFPDTIEEKVENVLKKLKIAFVPVYFGRKEIELWIMKHHKVSLKYNRQK